MFLVVSPSGNKNWPIRFQMDGRKREMGLGATKSVSLAEARARASAL
ncbi:MAG: DUF4102 domain-containing protein [Kordiimonadaceae bacterium]|nr:DUF4102 domain-containing protein [Kordiimonadaceae bacterium]